MPMLQEGHPAPAFRAKDQDGVEHTLDQYKGQWVLLYFYPRDNTPGCTKEACGFRDYFAELSKYAVVLGVSADSIESHKKFATQYELPFPLLSGKDTTIVQAYGADGVLLKKRVSFLVNPEGNIHKIYTHVKPVEHPVQVLNDLQALQQGS